MRLQLVPDARMMADEEPAGSPAHTGTLSPRHAEERPLAASRSTQNGHACFETPSSRAPQHDEGENLRSGSAAQKAGAPAGRAPIRIAAADPDLDLAREAASGSRSAFESLLRRHYDRIHRIAWRMTGSAQDAEDVAQDVCCALVEKIGGFRGEARFTTWLSGIVINACRDHLRRRQAQERQREGLSVLADLASPADGRDLYRQSWLASEIGRLPADLRETILLVAGEGFTHAEAGAALGIAETTVSWRLHEARRLVAGRT